MPLSGLPTRATPGRGLDGLPRRRAGRPLYPPPAGINAIRPSKSQGVPIFEDAELDDAELPDAAGDDRSEFNLGGGARWVRSTPTDDEEWSDE